MALYTLMQLSDQIFTIPLKLSSINNIATQVEVEGCLYTGLIECGNFWSMRTVLLQYCHETEQIFAVKGSVDITSVRLGHTFSNTNIQILSQKLQ